jgi:hypothetical protein
VGTGGGDEPCKTSPLLLTTQRCVSEVSCVRGGARGKSVLSSIVLLSVSATRDGMCNPVAEWIIDPTYGQERRQ